MGDRMQRLLGYILWVGVLSLVSGGHETHAQVPDDAPITIGVSPPRFELEIGDKPLNESLKVFNFGSTPSEIRVSVHDWDLDDQNQVRMIAPTEQSLDQWLLINPVVFTIPPGEYQTVRFSVRPKVQPTEGEHRAIIYFRQAPKQMVAEGNPMRIVGKLGVAVYGYVGDVERKGVVNALNVEMEDKMPLLRFDLSSQGSAHARMSGHYTIWPASIFPGADYTQVMDPAKVKELILPAGASATGWLPRMPVLPAQRRTLELPVAKELPPGNYVLDINGEFGGDPLDLAIPFTVELEPESSVVTASETSSDSE